MKLKNLTLLLLAILPLGLTAGPITTYDLPDMVVHSTPDFYTEHTQEMFAIHAGTSRLDPRSAEAAYMKLITYGGRSSDSWLHASIDPLTMSGRVGLDLVALSSALHAGPDIGGPDGGPDDSLTIMQHLYPQNHPKWWLAALGAGTFMVGEREAWWDLVSWGWLDKNGNQRTTGSSNDLVAKNADGTVVGQINVINSDYVDLDLPASHVLNIINSTHVDVQRDDEPPEEAPAL